MAKKEKKTFVANGKKVSFLAEKKKKPAKSAPSPKTKKITRTTPDGRKLVLTRRKDGWRIKKNKPA